jgi:hypothetical protein
LSAARIKDAQGFNENKGVVRLGGDIAGDACHDLERGAAMPGVRRRFRF